jgi:nucleoside-diphosphate-sugar epimerase
MVALMPTGKGETVAGDAAKRALVFGLGYVGEAFAAALRARGWTVTGTRRGGGLVFDGAYCAPVAAELARADAVLASIPPDEAGDPAFLAFQQDLAARPRWIGYLSTTGVYGDLGGRWAFEATPLNPASEQGRRRVLAEGQWLSLPHPAQVFRLPGIYGPGRSAFDRLRAGDARRIIKPGQVFSRAHVDDIVSALAASLDRPNPGRAYNVCDDEPAPPQDVIAHAAQMLGMEPPPDVALEQAGLSPMAQRFYAENKRVSNACAKAELGWRPLYPTYREGLAAILKAEQAGC